MLAALDFEFRFPMARSFDWTRPAHIICGVIVLEDGKKIEAVEGNWFDLAPYLDSDLTICMHHGHGAERPCLKQLGLPWPKRWIDTELLQRTLDIAQLGYLHFRYKLLDCLDRREMGCRSAIEKELMQKAIVRGLFTQQDMPKIIQYCADDCKDTLKLAQAQVEDFLKLSEKMQRLYVDLFQPFMLQIADIASHGLMFDEDNYVTILNHQEELQLKMQREMNDQGFLGRFMHAWERLSSPALNIKVQHSLEHLRLFDLVNSYQVYKSDLEKPRSRQRRRLKGLFKNPPKNAPEFIKIATRYHEFLNLCQTDWLDFIDADNRIRPNLKFPGTSSARVMQYGCHPLRLPKFGRPLFHASPGMRLYEFDFKAQEIALASSYFEDSKLLEIYNTHTADLYATIGVAMGEFPKDGLANVKAHQIQRDNIKVAILAMSYGGGINAICENLGCTEARAREIYQNFWNAFGDLRHGRNNYIELCRRRGYAENKIHLQRKFRQVRFLQDGPKDQTLSYLNFPIQSAGAAVLMFILKEMPPWVKVVLTTHDGLIVEGEPKAEEAIKEAVFGAMARAMGYLFPDVAIRRSAHSKSGWHGIDFQSGFHYHKDSETSLFDFCQKLGLTLKPIL